MTAEHPQIDPLAARDAGDKAIRGSGLRAAAHIVGVLVGVISAPLVVRHLGVADYGRFAVVNSIIFIATGLTEGGLAAVATREYAVGSHQERQALITNLLGLRIVLSLLGAIGAVLFGLIAGYPRVVVTGLALGGVALVANTLWGTLHLALTAGLRLGVVAALEMVRSVSTTVLFIVLIVVGAELLGFYFVAPVVAILTLVCSAWAVRGLMPLRPAFQVERWKALLRETALYAAAATLGSIYFQIALVTTSLLTSDHETGLYGIAFRIVELVNGVPWLLAGSVFPIIAHAAVHDEQRLRYAVTRVTETGLIAGGWFALTVMLGAQFAIDVVAGPEGDGSVAVLRILSVGVMATFLVAPWGFVLLSRRRYRAMIAANGSAFLLAIVASLVLVPAFGAKGSGAVTALLEITLAAMLLALLARELPGTRPGLRVIPALAVALAAGLAAGVPLLVVHPIAATIAGGAAYFAVLATLKAMPPELLQAVRRR